MTTGELDALAERIAALVAEQLRADMPDRSARSVDATELARRLGVSRAYVYAHADELGAVRLGTGPRARLRFDPDRARAALSGDTATVQIRTVEAATTQRAPGRGRTRKPGSVLTARPSKPDRKAA